eukprot:TRINITY_DN6532_c0_g1_i1.p1 TRINITY_DN6532_c0_g1~~TRINITY_DN6532_c0_g1_i1.p1  ORF type:complete len:283 (+),score=123.56 TRINITY_DN6532_c0_g1_i1:54-902(+)
MAIVHKPEFVVPKEKIEFYRQNGFVALEGVVSKESLEAYKATMDGMLEGSIDVGGRRGDLGGHATKRLKGSLENVAQITHPDMCVSTMDECELVRKARDVCNQLYGIGEFALDVTQFLVKFPQSQTETPWHQDAAYYPPLEDDRACNVWCALEDATIENGCMAYHPVKPVIVPRREVPAGGYLPQLTPHYPAGKGGGALMCDLPPHVAAQKPVHTPLKAGGIVVFSNYTYHYGGPNNSNVRRPALVAQMRPAHAVAQCRRIGFDHGKFQANTGENRTQRGKL